MSWNPIDESIDQFTMGGKVTPGIAEISGANSPRAWEEMVGPGLSGARLVFRGLRPSHFSLKFTLRTRTDWADWTAFANVVKKPPYGKRPRAIDIVHPLLASVGIKSVVVEDVIPPQQTADGIWEAEIKVIEFRAPVPGHSAPEGSDDEPVDPVEAEIKRKRQEAAEKHKRLAALRRRGQSQ